MTLGMSVVRPPQFDPKWRRKRRWSARWQRWRSWLVIVGLIGVTVVLTRLPTSLRDSEAMDGQFTLCGEHGSAACVIDGDTIAIGQRRIRLTGFDAPEMDGACEAEQVKARAARGALRDWLNQAPFLLGGGEDPPRDQYGRELRDAWRQLEGGGEEWLSEWMIDRKLAADNGWGGSDIDWCE